MTHEEREIRKHLQDLTRAVMEYLRDLDAVMKEPSDMARGTKIAALSNRLDLANDRARYFGLKVDYRTDDKVALLSGRESRDA